MTNRTTNPFLFVATCVLVVFSFISYASAQSVDPLAELEAWNKIKESSVAADYNAFLKKFPNGSLAVRARERMNTLGDPVWNELKKSKDPFKYRDYVKNNPNSPFLDQAKARLDVLGPAAIEWEKLKSVGDGTAVMEFIRNNPSHPFVEEAKADIENSLWTEVLRTGEERLLEFYALHYSETERGKEAASKLKIQQASKREADFQAIRSRISALNGVKVIRLHTGYPSEELWYENKVLDVCTLETVEFLVNTYNQSLSYTSKSFRIDLSQVRRVDSGPSGTWGYMISVSTSASAYSSPGDYKFSGSSQFYTRKSTSKPFVPSYSPVAHSESYVLVLNIMDSDVADKFVADLKKLVELCKSSK